MTKAAQPASVSQQIIDSATAVHAELGPDLLEGAYLACIKWVLEQRGLNVQAGVPVPVLYQGQPIAEIGCRIDLLVEEEIVVQVRALEYVSPIHRAHLLTCLKHAHHSIGFLLNFNVIEMKDGILRRVHVDDLDELDET